MNLPPPPDRWTIDIANAERVNATHWNANIRIQPLQHERLVPYFTGGLGAFIADAVTGSQTIDGVTYRDMRRATDFATNVGAGLTYRLTDWLGVGADYRSFWVYRNGPTERVDRVTAALTLTAR